MQSGQHSRTPTGMVGAEDFGSLGRRNVKMWSALHGHRKGCFVLILLMVTTPAASFHLNHRMLRGRIGLEPKLVARPEKRVCQHQQARPWRDTQTRRWLCQLPRQEEEPWTSSASWVKDSGPSEKLYGGLEEIGVGGGRGGKDDAGEWLERIMMQTIGASGVFMFCWVFLLFPGAAYTGFQGHDAVIEWVFDKVTLFGTVAPVSLITKSLLAPLQLFPQVRAKLGAKGHAVAGRGMLTAATALMLGYYIIDSNNLYADAHDFAGNGGGLAAWVDSQGLLPMAFNLLGVRMLAGYFVASGVATLVYAKNKDYERHKRWAIRHIGSGLWVAAQRPVFAVVRLMQAAVLGTEMSNASPAQGDAFYYAAYATTLVYMFSAEYLARRPAAPGFALAAPLSPPRAAVRAPGGGAAVRLEEERQRVKCAEAADLLRRKKEAGVLVAEEERLEMPQEGMLVVRGQREGS